MEPTALQTTWFVLITFLFIGYFVLEGFDFGVGMNSLALGRGDAERRGEIIETVGPIWDGNQVWVIVGGASIFAAFPEWYASLFSGFYLALLLLLLVLIARVCAFKYRAKSADRRWLRAWDTVHAIGGFAPALLWGVAFANIVRGVDIDASKHVSTSLLGLLNPFGLLGGVVFVLLFWTHGSAYLAGKTEGSIRTDANRMVGLLIWPTIVAGAAFLIWNQLANARTGLTWIPLVIAALALLAVVVLHRAGHEVGTFLATSVAIMAAGVQMFGGLFPDVLPAHNAAANSLTVMNASSSAPTLTVMLIAVCVFMPIVLAYQIWAYWVFRARRGSDAHAQQPRTLSQRARAGYRAAFEQD